MSLGRLGQGISDREITTANNIDCRTLISKSSSTIGDPVNKFIKIYIDEDTGDYTLEFGDAVNPNTNRNIVMKSNGAGNVVAPGAVGAVVSAGAGEEILASFANQTITLKSLTSDGLTRLSSTASEVNISSGVVLTTLRITAPQTIGDDTATAIANLSFGATDTIDTLGATLTTTTNADDTIVIPMDGLYEITAAIVYGDTNTTGVRTLRIVKNGDILAVGQLPGLAAADATLFASFKGLLQESDEIQFQFYQNSGGDMDVEDSQGTFFSITYIGVVTVVA